MRCEPCTTLFDSNTWFSVFAFPGLEMDLSKVVVRRNEPCHKDSMRSNEKILCYLLAIRVSRVTHDHACLACVEEYSPPDFPVMTTTSHLPIGSELELLSDVITVKLEVNLISFLTMRCATSNHCIGSSAGTRVGIPLNGVVSPLVA